MVNADDLKSSGPRPCRFDSCPGHQCIALEPTIDPRESDLPHLFAMAKRQKVLTLLPDGFGARFEGRRLGAVRRQR